MAASSWDGLPKKTAMKTGKAVPTSQLSSTGITTIHTNDRQSTQCLMALSSSMDTISEKAIPHQAQERGDQGVANLVMS